MRSCRIRSQVHRAAMSMRAWLAALLMVCACLADPAMAEQTLSNHAAIIDLRTAEAVPDGWDSQTPPADGWTNVTLRDSWDSRWPHHDGVVWYRLHWQQTDANAPVGLLLDYACLADEVWVNGSLVHRDSSLVEPLSRSSTAPQRILLDRRTLHAGDNTLLVRVSGLAAYQPGLGTVSVGTPEVIEAIYQQKMFVRVNIQLINFAMEAVLGLLFLMFWLLRRNESIFGWYALSSLFGCVNAWNFVPSNPLPFASTDAWESMIVACYTALTVTFCVFLLRFCEQRWRRTETVLLLAAASALLMALLAPHVMGPWRNLWELPTAALSYVAVLIFLWHAVRTPRADLRVMAACLLIPLVVSLIDLLVYLQIIPGTNSELQALTSPLTLIGMSFTVAWRFSAAMRRAENFNVELQQEVDVATSRLSDTLSREHMLALANTRIGERLNLVRDLHDGFGGSLLGAISALEDPRCQQEPAQVVAVLKELRDDLRLVIDTTTHEQDTNLGSQIAPLRHRWSQRLEAADIDSRWSVEGVEHLNLGAARALELLRFLQEALTNVLKHSRASLVQIRIHCEDDKLSVDVHDNGQGFLPNASGTQGAGLPSLRARVTRLGAALCVTSPPGSGTHLSFIAPLDPTI